MNNTFTRFVKKVVDKFAVRKHQAVVEKQKDTKVETGRSKGSGILSGINAAVTDERTREEIDFARHQRIEYWKKVMKRRMKKGRGVKNAMRNYKKALGSL